MKHLILSLLALCLIALPVRAADSSKDEPQVLRFGLISTESTQNLKEQWLPFLADMEKKLGMKVEAFFAPDYAGVIEAMRFKKVDLAWYGNKAAIEAVDRAGGEVFVKMVSADGYPGYHSVLIVNKDSPIKTLGDVLKQPGKFTFGNGDPNSTSGFLIPSYYVFAKNKIDPKTHFTKVTNANHEFNALAVANGLVDVATCNTSMVGDPDRDPKKGRLWETKPELAEKIRIIWKSPLIAHEPIVYRADLSPELKTRLRDFFTSYGKTPEEAAVLAKVNQGMKGFLPSDNSQLDPIREVEAHRDALLKQ
jgi:phosphonate transport system substrate-binding protein